MTNALARGDFTIGDAVRRDQRKSCKKPLSVFPVAFSLPGIRGGLRTNFSRLVSSLSRIIFEKSAFSVFRNFILYFYIFFFTILMIFRVEDSFFLRFTMSK